MIDHSVPLVGRYTLDALIKAAKREVGMRNAMLFKADASKGDYWRERIDEAKAIVYALEELKKIKEPGLDLGGST